MSRRPARFTAENEAGDWIEVTVLEDQCRISVVPFVAGGLAFDAGLSLADARALGEFLRGIDDEC